MIAPSAPWSRDNAILLDEFLKTGTGEAFLANLALDRPRLHGAEASDINTVALRAQYVAGHEHALYVVQQLATVPPEAPKSPLPPSADNWPDLDAP